MERASSPSVVRASGRRPRVSVVRCGWVSGISARACGLPAAVDPAAARMATVVGALVSAPTPLAPFSPAMAARSVAARVAEELGTPLGALVGYQVRFEGAFAALAPQLKVIAPWREWEFNSRQSLLNYLAEKNVPTTATATKIYSRDANLWHISHEGGEIENPWNEPSDQIWMWTKSPEQAPDKAEHIQLSFEKGELTAINGNAVGAIEAIEQLNAIGSEHGVGRIDIVENRLVGMKSRGCYETPGGTIIVAALRALESK